MAKEVYEVANMQNKKLSLDDISILVLVFAVIFGTFWRLFPVWLAGFPINDGGMFYTMIQDLQSNQYRLPTYTSYNNSNIPFAYPPLGFYLGAMLTDLFGLSTPLLIIQWLPGILNSISILAFYFFAKEITQNNFQSAIASFVFSFTPHMTSWFSMGGGLTRSLGAIFMFMAITSIYKVLVNESKKNIWGAVLFSGLTTLSHPESAMYTVVIAIYIWFMKSRSYSGAINALLIAIGTFLFISIWLLEVIQVHRLTPFISASQTGLHSFLSIFKILNINQVTEEFFVDVFGVIGIMGIALLISKKKFFIPTMLLITFLFIPRSAHTLGNITLSLSASFFMTEIILANFDVPQKDTIEIEKEKTRSYKIFLLILIPFIFANSLYYSMSVSRKHISEETRKTMDWIKESTPEQSRFLIITGETNGFCDATNEWFPALTNRKSLVTLQGNEWIQGSNFNQFAKTTQSLQMCYQKGLDCILSESKTFSDSFDYVYIELNPPTFDCNLNDGSNQPEIWVYELEIFPQFQIVFQSEEALIIQLRK